MTKWYFRMEKASKDWLRNKILWLSDQNSRKKSHVTEYPYIGDHFRKWFEIWKRLYPPLNAGFGNRFFNFWFENRQIQWCLRFSDEKAGFWSFFVQISWFMLWKLRNCFKSLERVVFTCMHVSLSYHPVR